MGSYLNSGGGFYSVASKPGGVCLLEVASGQIPFSCLELFFLLLHTFLLKLWPQNSESFPFKNTQACLISSVSSNKNGWKK